MDSKPDSCYPQGVRPRDEGFSNSRQKLEVAEDIELPNQARSPVAPLIPHSDWDRVSNSLSRCARLASSIERGFIRVAHKKWMSKKHAISGIGSTMFGARYTPIAATEVVRPPCDRAEELLIRSF